MSHVNLVFLDATDLGLITLTFTHPKRCGGWTDSDSSGTHTAIIYCNFLRFVFCAVATSGAACPSELSSCLLGVTVTSGAKEERGDTLGSLHDGR